MADPQVDFNPAPPPDFNPAPPPTHPDDARQTFIQNHPGGPEEGQAALSAAEMLSPIIHPTVTAQHPGIVGETLWGKAKMSAKDLYEKTRGTVEGFFNQSSANALIARQLSTAVATGKEDPELQKRIDEAQKNAEPKKHLGMVPSMILQIPLGLGYDMVQAGAFVSDNVAAALTLEPLRRAFGLGMGSRFYEMGQVAGEKFMGSFTAATYDGLRKEGIPPNIAAPFSLGGGLLGAVMFGLKVEAIPAPLGKAVEDATAKAGISEACHIRGSAKPSKRSSATARRPRAATQKFLKRARSNATRRLSAAT